jgi:choice-of-anchor A domain-containing protein
MKSLSLAAASLLVLSFGASNCEAGSLGIAGNYTEFILGTSTRTNVDSEGQVAVGGTATFNNFTFDSNINASNIFGTNSLIVGGDLGGSQTVVQGFGNALYDSKSTPNLYFNGGGSGSMGPSGTLFSDARTYLTNESSFLSGLAANGTTTVNFGALSLTGSNNSLDIFTVTGAQLAAAAGHGLSITAPAGATVLVNVDGTSDNFSDLTTVLNNVTNTHVLFNFSQATSLALGDPSKGGLEGEGTILAPNAAVTFTSGQINGSLIAASLTGTGETHLDLFTGTLPLAVPEPSSIVMAAIACITGVFALARKRFA